jgi:hypothetical protein
VREAHLRCLFVPSSLPHGETENQGTVINRAGFIPDPDAHYHFPGPGRAIRWSTM